MVGAALADAGVAAADIDEMFVGHINAGFAAQEFPASLVMQAAAGAALQAGDAGGERLRHRLGRDPCRARQHRRAAGAARAGGRRREDDGHAAGRRSAPILLKASYVKEEAGIEPAASPASSPASPSNISRSMATSRDALARIAAKNHRNGVGNPYAQMRKDLGYEFCRTVSEKNPLVAGR